MKLGADGSPGGTAANHGRVDGVTQDQRIKGWIQDADQAAAVLLRGHR